MNHKRGKPRSNVRCQLCTDNRRNIGGDRLRERRLAFDFEEKADAHIEIPVCPDCDGSGQCSDCPGGVCVLCLGSGHYD